MQGLVRESRMLSARGARRSRKPVAVITGTTHGIGRVTSRELARAGFHVTMLCRDTRLAEQVRDEILTEVPRAQVSVLYCDLARLDSVRACALRLRRTYAPLTLLINNAGIVSTRRRVSVDGFELTMATNHLGPFLLTGLLLDCLAPQARIITVSSRAHYRGHPDFESVARRHAWYNPMGVYAWSKMANVMHTFALARRLQGTGITANCLHPGIVASNLLPPWLRAIKPLLSPSIVDIERGAATTLHLALTPELESVNGAYFDEYRRPRTAAALAYDVGLQEELWARSLRWVEESAAGRPENLYLTASSAAEQDATTFSVSR